MPPHERTLIVMGNLVRLFSPHVQKRETWHELDAMIRDERTWQQAHALFDRMRDQTLSVGREGSNKLGYQYAFEETCAKTLYNFSCPEDPFDLDSAFWVIPIALDFARVLGLPDSSVVDAIAA
jgi:hypothetical protein